MRWTLGAEAHVSVGASPTMRTRCRCINAALQLRLTLSRVQPARFSQYLRKKPMVSRYKVLWIGKIAKHKGIGETKVLRRKKKAKVLWIYWLP